MYAYKLPGFVSLALGKEEDRMTLLAEEFRPLAGRLVGRAAL